MWNLLLNEDETMIAEAVRDYLAAEMPLERLRPKAKTIDSTVVREGMARLGWFSVGLPEAAGGSGLGLVEETLIQREFGRYLVSPSTLAIVLAGHICVLAGDEALARSVTSGKRDVSLGLVIPRAARVACSYAFDWNDNSLMVAWTNDGMGLFGASAFKNVEEDSCIDDSLTMHAGELSLRKATHWIPSSAAPLVMRARVMLAAALTGLAEHACTLTVEYARIREQFGKPIGTFQAVKHRCADMGVRARLAWYQTSLASLKAQAQAKDSEFQVASALLVAADAAHENGRAGIQMHGGIGFQAECDVHWFMKRAHVYDQLAGGRQRLSENVLARFASD
jgi:alkylation response protein AidB-like acyl-CoA dehydrogenase